MSWTRRIALLATLTIATAAGAVPFTDRLDPLREALDATVASLTVEPAPTVAQKKQLKAATKAVAMIESFDSESPFDDVKLLVKIEKKLRKPFREDLAVPPAKALTAGDAAWTALYGLIDEMEAALDGIAERAACLSPNIADRVYGKWLLKAQQDLFAARDATSFKQALKKLARAGRTMSKAARFVEWAPGIDWGVLRASANSVPYTDNEPVVAYLAASGVVTVVSTDSCDSGERAIVMELGGMVHDGEAHDLEVLQLGYIDGTDAWGLVDGPAHAVGSVASFDGGKPRVKVEFDAVLVRVLPPNDTIAVVGSFDVIATAVDE